MSEQRRKRGPGVCYSFQRGECDRGDGCRYLHEMQERKRTGVCYSYQRGECHRGDRCRYLHEEVQRRRSDEGGGCDSTRDRHMDGRREASRLPPSKYARGTRYDRNKVQEKRHDTEKTELQKPTWTPKPSPPGSWAAIVAAAAKKLEGEEEGERDSGVEADE